MSIGVHHPRLKPSGSPNLTVGMCEEFIDLMMDCDPLVSVDLFEGVDCEEFLPFRMDLIVCDGLFAIILAQSIHGATATPGSQTTRHATTRQYMWHNFVDNKTYDTDTSQITTITTKHMSIVSIEQSR